MTAEDPMLARSQAMATLIRATGDDPARPGLAATPERAARAHAELFDGYDVNPQALLAEAMEAADGYGGLVLVRGIRLYSHCEHHMLPMEGVVHVGYLPDGHLLGLSKIARAVEVLTRQLQGQERLTKEIADMVEKVARPKGVAVAVAARHHCITERGVRQTGSDTVTLITRGVLDSDPGLRRDFLGLCGLGGS